MSKYSRNLVTFKEKIVEYLKTIFKVYGDELQLMLEDYNLLSDCNNCIETSTSTGFILEEFTASKLKLFTMNHKRPDIKIERIDRQNSSTADCSYDCYSEYENIFFMINIKTQKSTSTNNAVAAINILHRDYCKIAPEQEKSYVVLKIYYEFAESKKDGQRKIIIYNVDAYCLEEIDFSGGHKQDHRNWSKEFNPASGRLQITKKFKEENIIPVNERTYEKTKKFIEDINKGKK